MKKILVVEDEIAYSKLLRDQLIAKGYETIDAKDGLEGLKLALTKKPDLILLDLIIPKVSGLKMLTTLRRFKWGESVPVFILTNVYGANEISEAMNIKVSKYIVKSESQLENVLDAIKIFLQRGWYTQLQ
jgi:DNA-binding response OmpR family regulator